MKLQILIVSLFFCATQQSFGMSLGTLQKISNLALRPKQATQAEILDIEWSFASQCTMFRDFISYMGFEEIPSTEIISVISINHANQYPGLLNKKVLIPDGISLQSLRSLFDCIKDPKKATALNGPEIVNLFELADRIGAPEDVLKKLARRLDSNSPFTSEEQKDELLEAKRTLFPERIESLICRNSITPEIAHNRELVIKPNTNLRPEEKIAIKFNFSDMPLPGNPSHIKKITLNRAIVSGLTKKNMRKLKQLFPNLEELCVYEGKLADLAPDFLSECTGFTLSIMYSAYDQRQHKALESFEQNRYAPKEPTSLLERGAALIGLNRPEIIKEEDKNILHIMTKNE